MRWAICVHCLSKCLQLQPTFNLNAPGPELHSHCILDKHINKSFYLQKKWFAINLGTSKRSVNFNCNIRYIYYSLNIYFYKLEYYFSRFLFYFLKKWYKELANGFWLIWFGLETSCFKQVNKPMIPIRSCKGWVDIVWPLFFSTWKCTCVYKRNLITLFMSSFQYK